MVNPAVYHASTVLFDTVEALHDRKQEYVYGRRGTPTVRALELAIAEHEGGFGCKLHPSGLSAAATTLLAFLKPGDHLLMTDAVYQPVRLFCDRTLQRLGIATSFFDPAIGGAVEACSVATPACSISKARARRPWRCWTFPPWPRPPRSMASSPPSTTPGAPAIISRRSRRAAMSRSRPPPNMSAATPTSCWGRSPAARRIGRPSGRVYEEMGLCVGPDDVYLGLRGLRTLDVRLRQHMASAMRVAAWLAGRPEVAGVLYPALPGAPGHELSARDFTGACGLFSILLKPVPDAAVAAMLEGLQLFGMGYSWGGFESLAVPFVPVRAARPFAHQGPAVRLHIGLEDPDDLIADLAAGFARLAAASQTG